MESFEELSQATSAYLAERRKFAAFGKFEAVAALALVDSFNSNLPNLAAQLNWDTAPTTYAANLIGFALAGINVPAYVIIWEKYYGHGISLRSLANQIHYSERNAKRLITKFPIVIVEQLSNKNLEIYRRDDPDPFTLQQARRLLLVDRFGLTPRQAEVLAMFCEYFEPRGRANIRDELGLSEVGLKKHIRGIIRKLAVPNMAAAVKLIRLTWGEPEPE